MIQQEKEQLENEKINGKICIKREQRHDDSICNKIREMIKSKNSTLSFTKTIRINYRPKMRHVNKW